jgi:beta-glucosidase
VTVSTADGGDRKKAARLARAADIAVVVVGDRGRESRDRKNLALEDDGDDLIEAVVKANPRTVVVLNTSGPVTMPWLKSVPAVLEAWYPGQENGHALAAVLTGTVNPSGKLPVTFPKSLAQGPTAKPPRYPARNGVYRYSERLEVGYRWYDAHGLAPLFPFGSGLSYTTFELSDLRLEPTPGGGVAAHFRITNTGTRAGTETVQVYVAPPAAAGLPPRALAGFTKVTLDPGAAQEASVPVPASAFTRWDTTRKGWAEVPGSFGISVGTSSRSLPLSSRLDR